MSIELTIDQAEAIAREGDGILVIDPASKQTYRLISEQVFTRVQALLYDDTPWTPEESAMMAGIAFSQLDDTDYSEYLLDTP